MNNASTATDDTHALDADYGDTELSDAEALHAGLVDPTLADPVMHDSTLGDPTLHDPVLGDPTLDDPTLDDPALHDPTLDVTDSRGHGLTITDLPLGDADTEADIDAVAGAAAGIATGASADPPPELSTLEGREVSAWFGNHKVLERVSLTMPAGQVTALIGPSGCGKSTFLRTLNRMHELIKGAALAGSVLLDGQDIYDSTKKVQDARKNIGMVFQKPNPFPAMSIYDNVLAGLDLTGKRASQDEKDEIVYRSLNSSGLWKEVKDRLKQPGGGLSGGQQQRLCIARSIAVKPKVLLMDEPCSALDPTSTRVIEETMVELQKEVTIVIVTHNMQQAQRVSTQTAFFLAAAGTPGAIVEHGDTEAIFAEPQDQRTWDYVNGRFG